MVFIAAVQDGRLGFSPAGHQTRRVTRTPLTITQPITDWRERAECAGHPNQAFFPLGDGDEPVIARAKAICSGCSVTEECLQYALETNQRFGIWAGTTEAERRSIRRKWLAARRRAG